MQEITMLNGDAFCFIPIFFLYINVINIQFVYMRMTKTIHSSWLCVCVYYLFRWKRTRIRFYHWFLVHSSSMAFFFWCVCCLPSVRLLLSFYLIVQCKTFALFNFFSFCNVSRSRHARRLIYGRKEEKLLRLSCIVLCFLFQCSYSAGKWERQTQTHTHTHEMKIKKKLKREHQRGRYFLRQSAQHTTNRQHLCAMHERWLTAEEWIPKD